MGEFIVIEGNIGAGKTSLSKKLSADLGCRLLLEQFEDNSFLPKFYTDPARYSFPLELSFLAERYQQLRTHADRSELFGEYLVADYFIHKCLIFAGANLQEDEFRLYSEFFHMAAGAVARPQKLVFLHMDTPRLLSNIAGRGRPYEAGIQAEYLDRISDGYFRFFRQLAPAKGYTILILDTNSLDFVHSADHYEKVKTAILANYPAGIHRLVPGENM